MTDIAVPTIGWPRRAAFYLVVSLLTFFLGVGTFIVLLAADSAVAISMWPIVGWFPPHTTDIHQLHNINQGWGVWIFLPAILLQLHRPEEKVAAMQMAIILLLASAAVNIPTGPWPLSLLDILPFFTLTILIAVLHPRRREIFRLSRPKDRALLAMIGLAVVPVLVYSVGQLNLQLNSGDAHAQFLHYSGVVITAISAILAGLLAACKTRGWRYPAWATGFYALGLGLTSALLPEQASSAGVGWGILVIIWALAFIGVAEWRRRQEKGT